MTAGNKADTSCLTSELLLLILRVEPSSMLLKTGLGQTGLVWVRLVWVRLVWVRLVWVRLVWSGAGKNPLVWRNQRPVQAL